MGKDILIRDQIFSTYDSLYDAEKKVADYVAGHQEDVINMSVAELAQNCATSQATVIRFCKKIGCEGFHKLKLKLAGEQSKQEELAASNEINIENMEQSLHNIMVSKVEEIKATFHNFDQKELRSIVDAAEKVPVSGRVHSTDACYIHASSGSVAENPQRWQNYFDKKIEFLEVDSSHFGLIQKNCGLCCEGIREN